MKSAPRPCAHAGCATLVHDGKGRCERHLQAIKASADARRASARARGYDSAWERARAAYLRKHPLCASHMKRGLMEPASVVDHITPHRGDRTLFWDSANWQPLCKRCHDVKTAREDGGFGRVSRSIGPAGEGEG